VSASLNVSLFARRRLAKWRRLRDGQSGSRALIAIDMAMAGELKNQARRPDPDAAASKVDDGHLSAENRRSQVGLRLGDPVRMRVTLMLIESRCAWHRKLP